ncbi:PaaX family transcriptional regulator C-terminal domain-containing protein [Streptomyces albipurpureus]|uniref:PaaX domain-containing protein, C- domain protein n=1 Tax=Streptomyces albipurpureus TaxID=2897419 RepID=A0ABT0UZ30_9ACTN|nr:PaaX family transcriptional regulator C-terminal domain-containing protein [Streptomyces sp. CWNU-1]MCM2393736.1 PaaX domain-containing protein, C- domain protein [Streptomyces sp. CWNU-1]
MTGTTKGSTPSDVSHYQMMWRDLGLRPLKARSIIASALLGSDPAGLTSRQVVRFCGLFGVPDTTARVTLSRMMAGGELEMSDGRYTLAGRLAGRRIRQSMSRAPETLPWDGTFELEMVRLDRRNAADRVALRSAMHNLRLGEYREGLWMRPRNLDPERLGDDRAIVGRQCDTLVASGSQDPTDLVGRLWDLRAWQRLAESLRTSMARTQTDLDAHEAKALAPGFMVAAAVIHHFADDPLLPDELTPARWPAQVLREEWERFDASWQRLLREWLD